jgi:hypothetical protein
MHSGMDESLQKLITIEKPPGNPSAPGSADAWKPVELQVGVGFPNHYKYYIQTYGAGQWAGFFGIMDPFYEWKHPQASGYFRWMATRLEGLDEMRKQYPKYVAPYNRYPALEGVVPIGYDDNGGTLCFEVAGSSDSWPIVFLDGKLSERYDVFRGTIPEFLTALLREEFLPSTWPADVFPIERPAFRPYTNE